MSLSENLSEKNHSDVPRRNLAPNIHPLLISAQIQLIMAYYHILEIFPKAPQVYPRGTKFVISIGGNIGHNSEKFERELTAINKVIKGHNFPFHVLPLQSFAK